MVIISAIVITSTIMVVTIALDLVTKEVISIVKVIN